MIKIAVINPINDDGYARTIFDGLISTGMPFKYSHEFNYFIEGLHQHYCIDNFVDYAKGADLIFAVWNRFNWRTYWDILIDIDRWDKTIAIDASEIGKNGRGNHRVQKDILTMDHRKVTRGNIIREMLKRCPLYFRREKPYINGIIPLPHGIERKYINNTLKDIDFFCVFGQDEFPPMRKYATELLEKYCGDNGFTFHTKKVDRDEYYKLLSRSKVGISIGGGGYDCLRFWETLGNNCILLTERIDIYDPDSDRLNYDRIYQFSNLYDFQYQLEKIGSLLISDYKQEDMMTDYRKIIADHSTESRVMEIIQQAISKDLV